jgi:hypothetical protein
LNWHKQVFGQPKKNTTYSNKGKQNAASSISTGEFTLQTAVVYFMCFTMSIMMINIEIFWQSTTAAIVNIAAV